MVVRLRWLLLYHLSSVIEEATLVLMVILSVTRFWIEAQP
jgi:hypothetical protein